MNINDSYFKLETNDTPNKWIKINFLQDNLLLLLTAKCKILKIRNNIDMTEVNKLQFFEGLMKGVLKTMHCFWKTVA